MLATLCWCMRLRLFSEASCCQDLTCSLEDSRCSIELRSSGLQVTATLTTWLAAITELLQREGAKRPAGTGVI